MTYRNMTWRNVTWRNVTWINVSSFANVAAVDFWLLLHVYIDVFNSLTIVFGRRSGSRRKTRAVLRLALTSWWTFNSSLSPVWATLSLALHGDSVDSSSHQIHHLSLEAELIHTEWQDVELGLGACYCSWMLINPPVQSDDRRMLLFRSSMSDDRFLLAAWFHHSGKKTFYRLVWREQNLCRLIVSVAAFHSWWGWFYFLCAYEIMTGERCQKLWHFIQMTLLHQSETELLSTYK